MVRPSENWEHLVHATLQRDQLCPVASHGHITSGIVDAVPTSLKCSTNMDLILQAVDKVQAKDPNVTRIRLLKKELLSGFGVIVFFDLCL